MPMPWRQSASISTPTTTTTASGSASKTAEFGSSTTGNDNHQHRHAAERPAELDADYVDEAHIRVFERALSSSNEDANAEEAGGGGGASVEHIRSVSDFAPIRERVKRTSKKRRDVVREGWAYHVSRWPLLILIFTLITIEFLAYVLVRQLVNVIELFSGWRGEMGRLRLRLRRATSYDEWKDLALQLDELTGHEAWKKNPSNAYYDSGLVKRVTDNLRIMRQRGDAEGVSAILEVCLRSNFAGIESFRLYSETYFGTKDRIRDYIEEVERSIEYIRKTNEIPVDEKVKLFRYITKNNGATALCLSGGASFGYYHFGVVRALLDANLLPKVITGTSAGALVAAFVCTHTDDELRRMIIPELADRLTACEEPISVWARRWWRTGARFDTVQWARKSSFWTHGSMTFREAYERTGRILNVSVIPYDTHSPTKLLNLHTAPDCVIFTAIIASAAVPGILNPVVLMTKDRRGNVKPWQFQGRHKDGSLRVDIPLQSLHLFFNVTYSIISQVNPHIHLFFFQPRGAPGKPVAHRKGKGWRGGFFLSAAEQFLKLDLTKNFRVIRDLELMPELLGQNWSGVFLQKFEGSVTIWPKSRIKDWFRLLADPDQAELARMIRVGQLVTWPKLHMIENRMRIERQIDAGRAECRAAYAQAVAKGTLQRRPEADRQHTTDSSAFEDSDSDLDMGGPEANAPVPINDETLRPIEAEDERRDAASRRSPSYLSVDEDEDTQLLRRAASAPAESSNVSVRSQESARRRRKKIISRLGLTSKQTSPKGTPSLQSAASKRFDLTSAGLQGETDDDDDDDQDDDVAGIGRAESNGNGNGNEDDDANLSVGVSTGRLGQSEQSRQRRLSTGQLRLARRNRQQKAFGAFGSGASDAESGVYGDDA